MTRKPFAFWLFIFAAVVQSLVGVLALLHHNWGKALLCLGLTCLYGFFVWRFSKGDSPDENLPPSP
jgi:hypothetical protein